jgi:2-dehydropantoate 2-reductase
MTSLRVCIHGAGGLGSVVGGFLARAGHQVTLIARPAHVAAINQNGLKITGVRAEFTTGDTLKAVETPADVKGEIDYYILLTKAKGTAQALADAACLKDRIHCAMTMQNGIGKEVRLQEAFGADKVMGASIMEGATLVSPGHALNHMAVPVTAYFGELKGGESERSKRFAQAMTEAGLGSASTADIQHVLWEKVVQVGGASAWSASMLGAIPRLDFVDGITVRPGAEQYVHVVKDLLAVYHALGYRPQNFFAPVSRLKEMDEANFEDCVQQALNLGARFQNDKRPVRTSMHDDLVAGRKMEVDEVLGPLAEAATRLGVQAPTFMSAYRILAALNNYL